MKNNYSKEDIERLCCLIIRQISHDKTTPISSKKVLFRECGLDSIEFVSILVEIEAQFDIQFDSQTMDKVYDMTVSEIAEYVLQIGKL